MSPMHLHPNYNGNTMVNDYMMFKIQAVTLTNLKPIALNTNAANPADGQALTVIGFGATSEGGGGSNKLLKVAVNTVAHTKCNSQYGGEIDKNTMLCAAATGKDSCQGEYFYEIGFCCAVVLVLTKCDAKVTAVGPSSMPVCSRWEWLAGVKVCHVGPRPLTFEPLSLRHF